jgi:hypothetical protein
MPFIGKLRTPTRARAGPVQSMRTMRSPMMGAARRRFSTSCWNGELAAEATPAPAVPPPTAGGASPVSRETISSICPRTLSSGASARAFLNHASASSLSPSCA